MLYCLNLRKHSNQVELDQFFKTLHGKNDASQHITKSAFFQARKQLSHTAFIELNHQLNDDLYKSTLQYKTWKGFRLCAIDGTSIRLPDEPDITDHFGFQKGKPNQGDCSIGMASVFYDVLNQLVIDSSIHPNHTSEKDCAAKHLEYAGKNDLVIYDRGYNAFWLYALQLKQQRAFCMRAKTNQNLTIKAFIESNQKEAIVTFQPNKPSVQTCKERGLPVTPITLRLVRVDLPNEVEVLITNLMDTDQYDAGLLSVQQDFYAKIVAMNLTALMAMAAQKTVGTKTQHHRLRYQINFAQAVSKMKHRLVDLIRRAHSDITSFIKQTIHYISKTIEAIREGRSAPRRLKNIKNDIHFPAYKSAL